MNSNGFIPSISDEKGFSPRRRDKHEQSRAEKSDRNGTVCAVAMDHKGFAQKWGPEDQANGDYPRDPMGIKCRCNGYDDYDVTIYIRI